MLVLTRKSQERILIGDNIKVTILRVKGNAVRVGIDAPANVRVVRGELGAKPAAATPAATLSSSLEISSNELALEAMANSSDASAATEEAGEEAPESAMLRSRAPLADYLPAAAHAV